MSNKVYLTSCRFESVTDRFVTELGPIAAGQVSKDSDFKYENLVKGLKHIQLKVRMDIIDDGTIRIYKRCRSGLRRGLKRAPNFSCRCRNSSTMLMVLG